MKNNVLKEKMIKKNNATIANDIKKRKGAWNFGRYTTGKQRNICSDVLIQILTCHTGKSGTHKQLYVQVPRLAVSDCCTDMNL